GVLPPYRGLEEAGPALRPGREQAQRVFPGLVELPRGAQGDVPARCFGAEQVGEDALAIIGVVEEKQQGAQANQPGRAPGRAGQRIRAAVYVAHHVDSHATTVSGLSWYCRVGLPGWRDTVREYSMPALVQIPATANLADVVFRRAAQEPQAVVLRRPSGGS